MQSSRNKTKTTAIAFIALLMLSSVAAVAFAQTTLPGYTAMPDRKTITAVGVSPTLLGLTQEVTINILTYPAPSGPTFYAQSAFVNALINGFSNTSCTITKPDGTKDTFMPIDETLVHAGFSIPGQQQIVGSLQFRYKPDQVGNYTISASFPGKFYTTDLISKTANLSVYYKPSASASATKFTVQEDIVLSGQLNGWPWSPLPTAYWENPVRTDNREWSAISGAFIQSDFNNLGTKYNPYTTAPKSPHILWANRVGSAGLVGGLWGSIPYNSASASGSILMDGYIYQADTRVSGNFQCVNLRTGEVLWSVPGTINGAWQYENPIYQTAAQGNEGGADKWLWNFGSTNWVRYNTNNGAVAGNFTNAVSLSNYRYSNGDDIWWCVQVGAWNTTVPLNKAYVNLIKWNFTKVTNNNWLTGIMWNVSAMLTNVPGQVLSPGSGNFASTNAYPFDEAGVVIVQQHNDEMLTIGFDMATGARLWINNATAIGLNGANSISMDPNGPNINDAAGEFVAYNVKTGQEVWTAPVGDLPWSLLPAFTFVGNNGNFYYGSYDGHVYAIDIDTGERVWQSDYVGAEDESIYGHQPFNGGSVGGGGVLYYSTATTYSLEPRTRFHKLVAIDEATGHFIWTLPIGINPSAIAYGYLVGADGENGFQYCIGKGKTATTASIQNDVISVGSGALIKGTVMDLSPGQPNTPAVSDADMSEWMDYLHGQNATLINSPPVPKGVSVQLTALSSSGSAIDLGIVTSDESGQYAKAWTPSSEGLYKIYATFAGSESYWSSYAETALSVGPVHETDNTQPPAAAPDNTTLLYGILVAVVVAILIGLAALLSVFRKH
ncbi:MAG TPA: PQQ-binding-like beta-propeller repeat protein [Candidatus Bathyarchaeia archaeon]|nr:PQQ-binding-like beta-propeller repeat protein [Candidatus Bathyarchaeia archaeon]